MDSERKKGLSSLPNTGVLIENARALGTTVPHWALKEAARDYVEVMRSRILAGEDESNSVDYQAILSAAEKIARPLLQRVINATGVILHTNLGRAPLSSKARARVLEATGYCDLEFDLETGTRSSRHDGVASLLSFTVGAEDAVVVNNNAAAVLLCLSAICSQKEAIVSRGELVEIGGSFRVPDVMSQSGAKLVEVGTTNKTRLSDYGNAIGENTGAVVKIHRSNFDIVGFVEETEIRELAPVCKNKKIPLLYDLGSGLLEAQAGLEKLGLPAIHSVERALADGASLVMFSGDKVLGAGQAGVIAGSKSLVSLVKRHPLMRCLRPDKLALASLIATLEQYRDGQGGAVPARAMMDEPADSVQSRARMLADALGEHTSLKIAVVATECTVGGGCAPQSKIPSFAVSVTGKPSGKVVHALRNARVPVVPRVSDGAVFLEVRTIPSEDFPSVIESVRGL